MSISPGVRPGKPEGRETAPHAGERPFNLIRWFAVLGFLCIGFAAVGSAVLLTRFLASHMIQRDAEVSADFIGSIVLAERSWSYFEDQASPVSRLGMEEFFNHVSQLPDVVRANVYAADQTVLWSSNPPLIGHQLGPNKELVEALTGQIRVETGFIGQNAKSEHTTFGAEVGQSQFVEAYLPIWDAERLRVIGVVEIYKLPVSLFLTIGEGMRMVWIGAICTGLFLYISLFWFVRRADRLIRAQRESLIEAETLATIGAFAAAVAHGIRNPLAIMRSSAELAQDETHEPSRRETLNDLLREADRLDGWVRELLLGARGEAIAPGAVDVRSLLSESVRSFTSTASQQRIKLSLNSPPTPLARGEAGPLARAIDNIIANAIEAMPQGGELMIESALVKFGSVVEIRVADTGRGMSQDLARRVARPFYSTKPRGSGLGLALARRIVSSYSGTLTMATAEGQGTTVTIHLPAAA